MERDALRPSGRGVLPRSAVATRKTERSSPAGPQRVEGATRPFRGSGSWPDPPAGGRCPKALKALPGTRCRITIARSARLRRNGNQTLTSGRSPALRPASHIRPGNSAAPKAASSLWNCRFSSQFRPESLYAAGFGADRIRALKTVRSRRPRRRLHRPSERAFHRPII